MKIKDYLAVYKQLELEDIYKKVYNRVSRVRRSFLRLKKHLDTQGGARARTILKQYYKLYTEPLKSPQLRIRGLIVLPFMLNRVLKVYNGKTYVKIKIVKKEALGRYLSEFIQTRTIGSKQIVRKSKKSLRAQNAR